jgi:hypothetical protein
MNMQLGYFSQYIVLFATGIIAYRKNWLARIPYSFGIIWFKAALIGGSIFWLAIQILGGGLSGDFAKYAGGPLLAERVLCLMGIVLLCWHLPWTHSRLQTKLQCSGHIQEIHVG